MRALFLHAGVAGVVLSLHACSGVDTVSREEVGIGLAGVGLELISETEALIPAEERGKYLAVRVIEGHPNPALEPHPAGYLIVGFPHQESRGAAGILRALGTWERGHDIRLMVRRNPYLLSVSEAWESELLLRHP